MSVPEMRKDSRVEEIEIDLAAIETSLENLRQLATTHVDGAPFDDIRLECSAIEGGVGNLRFLMNEQIDDIKRLAAIAPTGAETRPPWNCCDVSSECVVRLPLEAAKAMGVSNGGRLKFVGKGDGVLEVMNTRVYEKRSERGLTIDHAEVAALERKLSKELADQTPFGRCEARFVSSVRRGVRWLYVSALSSLMLGTWISYIAEQRWPAIVGCVVGVIFAYFAAGLYLALAKQEPT
ncbi:MAG: hypothetical protein ACHREM_04175 [Polyangiales bacterium]